MVRIRRDKDEAKITFNVAKDCAWKNLEETVEAIREQLNHQLDTLVALANGDNDFTEVKYDAEGNLHCKKASAESSPPAE